MRYKIEFELPDNDTVLKEIKHASVGWQIWGYSGIAKPVPSIDAEERKKGTWIVDHKFTYKLFPVYCSNCHRMGKPTDNYCPNCGADMRERKES